MISAILISTYIDEHEIRGSGVRSKTCVYLRTEGVGTGHRVGESSLSDKRYRLPKDKRVQEMVNEIHLGGWIAFSPIHRTIEGPGHIERGFPDVCEF